MKSCIENLELRFFALLIAACGLAVGTSPAAADDTELLRTSSGRPYVFILFDTSGSMHWTPRCTQEQLDAGACDFLCPDGDCYAPLNGDDPAAKFYQAKDALHEVLESIDDIDFGFATYNQDGLRLRAKHWLYEVESGSPAIPGFGAWPPAGAQEVFGLQWDCDNGNGDAEVGCAGNSPADLNDPWELARVQRLPKGGIDFNQARVFYVRHPNASGNPVTYRVTYTPVSGTLGDPTIVVRVDPDRCTNSSCSTVEQDPPLADVTFRRLSDFNSWDNGIERNSRQRGYYTQGQAADSPAATSPSNSTTCAGWDPNDDTNADQHSGYSIRWPTNQHPDPDLQPLGDVGDVIPLSWTADNKQAILDRLAPNTLLGEATPDFRTARYFQNTPSGNHLLLRDNEVRPLVAFGATPLGASIRSFRTWYAGCPQGSCPNDSGWRDLAAERDPDWGCRRKFLLVLTDGDETCGGGASACNGTAALNAQESIRTYVVAFGVAQGGGNTLTCMSNNGGTGEPVYPSNKQELVDALQLIFGEIRESARSFASAAVPSVQAEVADKIYLTNFTPLNNASVWPGHVDAYLKPLPLDDAGLPDRDKACDANTDSACHAWDAGDALLLQAPTEDEVNMDDFKLGNNELERRVFYPKAKVGSAMPRDKRLFAPPSQLADWLDLWTGLGVPFDLLNVTPAENQTKDIIRFTLRQKVDTINFPDGTTDEVTYVLGDIFHANPEVISNPNRFRYFTSDLEGIPGQGERICNDDSLPEFGGYRCFFTRHRYRRKMLMIASNDGQVHAFDAGRFDGTISDGVVTGEFDDGTGHELFSIIPRMTLPKVRKFAETTKRDWTVDGTALVDDFFIDPQHLGTPDPDEREWRTVVLGGLREGGRGYYALDVTQPDKFKAGPVTSDDVYLPESAPGYVPSCLADYNSTDCGPLPFPSVLWEFVDDEVADEDLNTYRDLGETWSIPNSGRLRVIENGVEVDKYVAVVGGGMDPDKLDRAGDWLYIIDVETGKPIYKRQLLGSAPSEPAAVDTDQNGYIDTIYIGTTAGFMYKVDVGHPAEIRSFDLLGVPVRRITDAAWEPFPIFTTGGRPIYFPPSVVFVARRGQYALGFGSGDREDLWAVTPEPGRFYLILDQGFTAATAGLPFSEVNYEAIPADSADVDPGDNFLLNPQNNLRPGWHIDLNAGERVITKAFSLSGVTIFTSYIPEIQISQTGPNGGGGGNPNSTPICSKTGQSRIFVVFTENANSILTLDDQKTRYWLLSEFVTDPFTEQSATKNPPKEGDVDPHSDQLTDTLRDLMNQFKGLFPNNCKFANFTLNIKTVRSDTGVFFIAPIPICIVEKNWRDNL